MNKLSAEEKVRVVACLVEGNSLRATVRMTGIHRTTIQNLLVDLGKACSAYQDKVFRALTCKRVQCDEIWSFIGCKGKNATEEQKEGGWGDVWTWVAMDAQTKLVPCWYVGTRDGGAAYPLAVYPPCPGVKPFELTQAKRGHGGYTAVELNR